MTAALDCRTCGACCVAEPTSGAGFADLLPGDAARMSRRVRLQLVRAARFPLDDEPALATPYIESEEFGAVCTFLRGTPGKRRSCRIYATRPSVCSAFKPCREARREIGLAC